MPTQVLLVASDAPLRQTLRTLTPAFDATVMETPTRSTLSRFFENAHPDLVVIGPALPHPWDALHIARLVRRWTRRVPIIVITSHGSEELAIAAMRSGVSDYFKAPLNVDEFAEGLRRLVADASHGAAVQPTRDAVPPSPVLIGESREAVNIRTAIDEIAATDTTVLITGETGSGKELAAGMIHERSRRARHPFISINCAAIPESLLESELFGFERGSFTGAASSNAGRLSAAHRGTVLFDEVGDMTLTAQAKVLRLVEEKAVTRLGSTRTTHVDARVVTATNQNLEALMADGRFRSDLYFRLDVARIHLPPLRDRATDIPLLVTHYLAQICERLGREVEGFTDDALDALMAYDWPGNVREIRNLVERLVIHTRSRRIAGADIVAQLANRKKPGAATARKHEARVLDALAAARGNKSETARALGWSRMTLYRRLAAYTAGQKRTR
jgi:DNA-binding NtrC family response regulator